MLTSLSIFLGVYFGIYFPLLVRDFEETECIVADVQEYFTFDLLGHEYTQYKLGVDIEGVIFPGYGCESSGAYDGITNNFRDGVYPYQFADCEEHIHQGSCQDDQLFLPSWMCTDHQPLLIFEVGDKVKCWWHYYKWDDSVSSDTPDVDSDLDYPKLGKDFIEVMFRDSVHLPLGDYYCLWVLCFGIFTALPFALTFFCYIPTLCDVYSRRNLDRVLDCCEIFWCLRCPWKCLGKRRFFRPRSQRGEDTHKKRFEAACIWMNTSKQLKQKGLNMPRLLQREIASYICKLESNAPEA
jgi:hypothetical protein